jgi:hypothetical protein
MGGTERQQSIALREVERHSALMNGWAAFGGVHGVSKPQITASRHQRYILFSIPDSTVQLTLCKNMIRHPVIAGDG